MSPDFSAADLLVLFATAGTFLLAGFVKGVVAFGLPTVVMGLLALFMAPAEAATLLVVPAIVTNIWQMAAGPALRALLRRSAWLIAGIVAGTFATIGLLTHASGPATSAMLGAVLLLCGAHGLIGLRFTVTARRERVLSPAIGIFTGMCTGATGVYVVPVVPYLAALDLDKEELVQAIGISAFVCPVALGAALALTGHYPAAAAGGSFLALIPAFLGLHLGQRVRMRLHPEVFHRWLLAGLVALGGSMLLRGAVLAHA